MPGEQALGAGRRERLDAIQYLRAVAALMVVVHHARNADPGGWLFNPLEDYQLLARGVDVFFVISGFIMYFAARHERPREFLLKRVIRVVPLYWLATAMLIAVAAWFGDPLLRELDAARVLQSLAFVPHYDPSGQPFPVLVPGWTLNYEMFFYLVFFVGLLGGRLLGTLNVAILGLVAAGLLVDFDGAVMRTYTHGRMLEFLAGVWLGWLHARRRIPSALSLVGLLGFVGLLWPPRPGGFEAGIFAVAACSTLVVTGAVALGERAPVSRVARLLGDASYSIYLTHTILPLRAAKALWREVPLAGWPQFVGYLVFAVLVSTVVGVLAYLLFERPVLRWLRRIWLRRSA
jgi:exopolysaccharide production protein ExoZ